MPPSPAQAVRAEANEKKSIHSQDKQWQDSCLLVFLEANEFNSLRPNKKVYFYMGRENLMGYSVAWADSKATERPEGCPI